ADSWTGGRHLKTGRASWQLGGAGAHPVKPSTRWETIMGTAGNAVHREPWNKGKIVGQKAPFMLKGIWALRVRLQMECRAGRRRCRRNRRAGPRRRPSGR